MKNEKQKAFPSPVLGEGGGEGFALCNERPSSALCTTAAIFLFILIVIFLFTYDYPCANFNQATLHTPKQSIAVNLATTPAKQSKGLGGCNYIPKNSGMYFQFTESEKRTFWMKDMLIPIDIVWIQQGQVVGIEHNVPNMPLTTPDSELSQYTSPMPADAVLEVGAGMAQSYGIEVGSKLDTRI